MSGNVRHKASFLLLRPVAWWVRVIAAVPLGWLAYMSGFLYTHKCSLGSKLFEHNMPYVSAAVCALIVVLIPRLSIGVIIAGLVMWANWPLVSVRGLKPATFSRVEIGQ